MSGRCRELRELLAEAGADAVRADSGCAEHLEGCGDCGAVIGSLESVEGGLSGLGSIDAPDALVAATLEAVRSAPGLDLPQEQDSGLVDAELPSGATSGTSRMPFGPVGYGVAAAMLVAVVATGALLLTVGDSDKESLVAVDRVARDPVARDPVARQPRESKVAEIDRRIEGGSTAPEIESPDAAKPGVGMADTITVEAGEPAVETGSYAASEHISDDLVSPVPNRRDYAATLNLAAEPEAELDDEELAKDQTELRSRKQSRSKAKARERALGDVAASSPQDPSLSNTSLVDGVDLVEENSEDAMAARQSQQFAEQAMNVYGHASRRDQDESVTVTGGEDDPDGSVYRGARIAPAQGGREAARQLLDGRLWNPDLRYQAASGYWDNTYVPGDATVRLLETRLSEGKAIVGEDGRVLALDAASRQYRQPFDLPSNSALAVYLHADRRGFDERERMLLQVGLQGTSRASGLRPAMNVGVVLDLRSTPSNEASAGMRALLTALVEARQTGDRFSVTVAGVPGGQIVVPDEFRFGSVAVAMRQLFGDTAPAPAEPETLDLDAALERAVYTVAQADDPNAPLGASVVLLLTGGTFGDDLEHLEEGAHASAVAGIPLSVVGVGRGVDLAELGRLTLAGQGNRRLLVSPSEAERIVDRELHSASRVVARAVRLRIRLFPGVKLIDVIHSSRLDAGRASRVREAEAAIDARVARSLGIQADRGEDEEGIQIIIPSYYASDSHVILLDVVAERPGAIADVTVRYKDLVYLRNGVARTNLSIGPLRSEPGPLERNVLKNYVAARLSEGIHKAGLRLATGNRAEAIAELDAQVELIAGMRAEVPGWASDVELAHDLEMLAEYRLALESGAAASAEGRQQLSDSLRYAGRLKVLPRRR